MLLRFLAPIFNWFPVRWQRRILDGTHTRFLVGVVGLGIDPDGRILLARHRFGAPQWRFLGGVLNPGERLEDALAREVREETALEIEVGPLLEAAAGYRWRHVDLVYAYRVTVAGTRLSGELAELRSFDPAGLPEMRADQRGVAPTSTGPPSGTAACWAWTR
ncbi:MAG: NUDIX domain-containing protein [Chloroflexi bacterium]|nr:MAG: NUDIX domain-containing protein [Chloroflexota bacterium]